jgi:hypothetical protein
MIYSARENVTIRYTTDNTDPKTSPTAMIGAEGTSQADVIVNEDMVIHAYAVFDGNETEIATVDYEVALVYENFEDGSLGDWKKTEHDDTPVSIADNVGANGTSKSLYLDNTGTGGDWGCGSVEFAFPDGIKPSYISYWVMYKYPEPPFSMAVIFHDNIEPSSAMIVLYNEFVPSDGGIYYSFDDPPLSGAASNTWLRIEYRNMDWNASSAALYINGELRVPDISLHGVADIRLITLGSDVSGSGLGDIQEAWFDELVIK